MFRLSPSMQGLIAKPCKEAVTDAELKEAAFSIVKASHKETKTRPYHEQLLRWYTQPVTAGEAYTQRAAIFSAANGFLQAELCATILAVLSV